MSARVEKHVLMIDNYDSFTWNLYEYLCQAGAKVSVYRNDQITVDEITALNPDIIFISPGPGHPRTDSGVCREAIDHFKGKLPIVGVCMGQQCIFEVFGGSVEFAGEIVHGKTSAITHDNRGMFKNVPQGVAVTRYHSLAGTTESLPDCLEVTAETESGIIMGVRHKEYTIEGVQFHPESILTEEGHLMIKNILSIEGGYWTDSKSQPTSATTTTTTTTTTTIPAISILDKIFTQRRKDVEADSAKPGCTFADLQTYYSLGLAPAAGDFYGRLASLTKSQRVAVIAEIKRASPSKGDIAGAANAAAQAAIYAEAGVAAISVLTEPNWFKGSLEDLKNVRKVVDRIPGIERPLVLRKEFVFNEYQILEARLAGADTVLLIVKMLTERELVSLLAYSRELDMEPLVEVNTAAELATAVRIGAKVVGVNNRDLNTFNVDLNTTGDVMSSLDDKSREEVVVLALSGISTVEDVRAYTQQNVYGFLIGEALMQRGDAAGEFITELKSVGV